MRIQTCILGRIRTNCYIITNEETKKAIIIDPADQAQEIEKKLKEQELIPVAILLTHGHFDHIMAASALAHDYNIPIYASEWEKELLADPRLNCSETMSRSIALVPNILLKDNEQIALAGMNIKVIHTPGHTAGGVCYYFFDDVVLFSGDTLFFESTGRTDFPTGNAKCLLESIHNKLMALSNEVKVYPGHGVSTTIGYERSNNPYLSEEGFWN